ncbi:ABC transporter permease [Clostridium butyricum]|uniref:ABC transporter permease n=1 Tax=Clostridium butyricum TaxID=1492 RepID=UPI0006E72C5D|nr:taurine ABC transporter permease [Clostridium butyricum]
MKEFFKKNFSIEKLLTITTVLIILGIWELLSKFGVVSEVLIPSPEKVWMAFMDIIKNDYKGISLLQHLYASMERLIIAYILAAITAIPLGLASGYNSKIRAIFEPIIEFYRPLPPLAYYTLLVLWMGIDNKSKITLLFLASFAPIYISCMSSVLKIRSDYIYSAYTVGANKHQIFRYVIFPSCLPDIFVGLRTAIGVAYTTLVAAEMVAAVSGIGWMVLDASKYLRSDIIFVGIAIMGITGILLDKIIRFIESKIVPWKGKE